jgi:hypothetical protein
MKNFSPPAPGRAKKCKILQRNNKICKVLQSFEKKQKGFAKFCQRF